MALLAEQLVEEWLRRDGYFTVRGARDGVHEIDLLGVRCAGDSIEGVHVEVTVSTNPIGYIAKLSKQQAKTQGRARASVKRRTDAEMREAIADWVRGKFDSDEKVRMRASYWPDVRLWKRLVVRGAVKYPQEVEMLKSQGVECLTLREIFGRLGQAGRERVVGAVGSDLVETIRYLGASAAQFVETESRFEQA